MPPQQPPRRDQHREAVEPHRWRTRHLGIGGIPRLAHAALAGACTALACLLRAIAGMLAAGLQTCPSSIGAAIFTTALRCRSTSSGTSTPCCRRWTRPPGPGPAIRAVLVRDEFRIIGQVHLPGCTLEVRRALEFWPLVGDSASPSKVAPRAWWTPARRGWNCACGRRTCSVGLARLALLAEGVELPMRRSGTPAASCWWSACATDASSATRPAPDAGHAGPRPLILRTRPEDGSPGRAARMESCRRGL